MSDKVETFDYKHDKEDRINADQAPKPVGPYPHARQVGDLVFLSGVGPRKRDSKEIPGVVFNAQGEVESHDIKAQTKAVIENIQTILKTCGCKLENIVDIQVFLTHMKEDFKAFNEVYGEYFTSIGPTRTTVEVTALPTPIAVEFKVIASV